MGAIITAAVGLAAVALYSLYGHPLVAFISLALTAINGWLGFLMYRHAQENTRLNRIAIQKHHESFLSSVLGKGFEEIAGAGRQIEVNEARFDELSIDQVPDGLSWASLATAVLILFFFLGALVVWFIYRHPTAT